jgi:hypothetical protein
MDNLNREVDTLKQENELLSSKLKAVSSRKTVL